MLGFLDRYRDLGLLLLRIGIGAAYVMHGWPKLAGGRETWAKVGGAMKDAGVSFAPEFWGLAAAVTEVLGGVLFAIGLFFRPVAILLLFTMIIATVSRFDQGFTTYSHPLKMAIVFGAMLLIGPGRYVVKKD
jgi:putative oxidoreductase